MPGLDEEFAYRGIMLGLLCSALRDHISIGKTKIISPAVLVTATLFGLIHGFPLTPYLDWKFDYFSFCYTFIFGLVYGWMVLKSRSVLTPTLTHSLTNFTSTLITMLK
jgi:membrane protease YdiL (CAAX protease family)